MRRQEPWKGGMRTVKVAYRGLSLDRRSKSRDSVVVVDDKLSTEYLIRVGFTTDAHYC